MDLEDQLDEKNKQIKEWEKKYNDLERQFKEYQNKSQDELKKASALQKELVYHEEFFIIFQEKRIKDLESDLKKSEGRNNMLEEENKNMKKMIADLNAKVQCKFQV